MPKALACLLLVSTATFADTIIRTTGNATADASVSFSVAGNALTTDAFTSVGAVAPPIGYSSATAVALLNINLFTSGSVRNGFVKVTDTRTWAIGPDGVDATLNYTLGSINGLNHYPVLVPFTLGTSFQFSETQDFEAYAFSSTSGTASAFGTTNLSFQFFEADGLTAVTLFDPPASAPEPSTLALIALAAPAILCLHVRSEQKKLLAGNGGPGQRS